MGLEDIFNQAVGDWIEHCKNPHVQASSSPNSIRDCDAYRTIISMGKGALPLLRQLYDADASFYLSAQEQDLPFSMIKQQGLVSAVREIVGDDFSIPEEIRGQISAIAAYTKSWLDENIHKYVANP